MVSIKDAADILGVSEEGIPVARYQHVEKFKTEPEWYKKDGGRSLVDVKLILSEYDRKVEAAQKAHALYYELFDIFSEGADIFDVEISKIERKIAKAISYTDREITNWQQWMRDGLFGEKARNPNYFAPLSEKIVQFIEKTTSVLNTINTNPCDIVKKNMEGMTGADEFYALEVLEILQKEYAA